MERVVQLKKGAYNESTLVDKVCTEAQRNSYHKKDRFASGKHRNMFLDALARYCDYKYDVESGKYIITEIYCYPKTLFESKVHKGIYQYIAPLILNEVLFGDGYKKRKTVITSLDLAQAANIIGRNYNNAKYNQDAMEADLHFPATILAEYFNKADNRIDDYIRQCIKYLAGMNCVIYNEVHMICDYPKYVDTAGGVLICKEEQVRKATDDEMRLYSQLVEVASKKANVITSADKWYGNKAEKYQTELKKLLKQNNILFVCRAFELWRVDTERCKDVLESFSDKSIEQRKQEIGTVLKLMMDRNAENRLIKNPSLGKDYLEQFKRLSDLTLPYDADDIMKQLPSARSKDKQEEKRKRYGFNIEIVT